MSVPNRLPAPLKFWLGRVLKTSNQPDGRTHLAANATARRIADRDGAALGVVRGDEPDSPGKRNLLTALIGLQRAADRRGNRRTRFRALVLQGAACRSECHRGLEGLFDPASTGNVEIEDARLKHN